MEIKPCKLIFWDFDGVIKDSVEVKTHAFEYLFPDGDADFLRKVRMHHEANGGMSRFDKIPLYLHWSGQPIDENQIEKYLLKFSEKVVEGVIHAPWVPGAREYLLSNWISCYYVLLTATPQEEIIRILRHLGISHCFREVYGSPINKREVVSKVLKKHNIKSSEALLIGDSEVDLFAAETNFVPFLLRSTVLNKNLQEVYMGPQFENFENE